MNREVVLEVLALANKPNAAPVRKVLVGLGAADRVVNPVAPVPVVMKRVLNELLLPLKSPRINVPVCDPPMVMLPTVLTELAVMLPVVLMLPVVEIVRLLPDAKNVATSALL